MPSNAYMEIFCIDNALYRSSVIIMTPHITTVLSGQNGDLVGHISHKLWQKTIFSVALSYAVRMLTINVQLFFWLLSHAVVLIVLITLLC